MLAKVTVPAHIKSQNTSTLEVASITTLNLGVIIIENRRWIY